jgi:hypothetical protein
LISDAKALKRSIKQFQEKIAIIEPEIKVVEKMSLSDWIEIHPDENYKGIFKGKKEGEQLTL